MALAPCRECGTEVSTDAKTCPKCGVKSPTKKPMGKGTKWFLGLAFGFILYQLGTSDAPPARGGGSGAPAAPPTDEQVGMMVISTSRDVIKGALKDPGSVQWGEINAHKLEKDGKSAIVACGSYNSKNSLGGYTGQRRFISNGATITLTEEQSTESEFREAWKLMCAGPVVYTTRGSS